MASPPPTSLSSPHLIHLRLQPLPSVPPLHLTTLPFPRSLPLHLHSLRLNRPHLPPLPLASSGSGSDITGSGGEDDLPPSGGGGGGGGGEGEGDGSEGDSVNRREALFVLAQLGRKLESLPADLAAAVEGGRIPGEIVRRFVDLEASPVFRWLLQFGGFKERLLADDLFLTKVAIECGVGIFTKVRGDFIILFSGYYFIGKFGSIPLKDHHFGSIPLLSHLHVGPHESMTCGVHGIYLKFGSFNGIYPIVPILFSVVCDPDHQMWSGSMGLTDCGV
jgi:hypothetical protein